MDSILLTGAGPNGITGRLIKERLDGKYNLLTPSSRELDLTDKTAVDNYFLNHNIDFIIHSAVQYITPPEKISPSFGILITGCSQTLRLIPTRLRS